MFLRYWQQELVMAWMCGLKDRAESKVILKKWTCGTGQSVESLIVTDISGGEIE